MLGKASQMLSKLEISNGIAIMILAIVYSLFSMYLYQKYGVKIMNDSPRYLGYASNLFDQGFYFDKLNFWYFSYVLFVYLTQLISESLDFLIISQYALGFVGTLAIYGAMRKISGNETLALLAGMIYIFFPDNIMWNSYVLTEGFYTTIVSIVLYLLVSSLIKQTKRSYLYAALGLIVCFLSKPTSPAILLALASPFLIQFYLNPSYRLVKIGSSIIGVILMLLLANQMITAHRVLLIYEKGDIIFAMHELPNHPHHDLLTVDVPEDLYIPEEDGPLLVNMGEFVAQNPLYFAKLMVGKVILFVTHMRPYWSWTHNLMIIVFLWGSYYFSFVAFKQKLLSSKVRWFALTFFSMLTLIISITWADWDGRFFVPLIPMLVLLASIGIGSKLNLLTNPTPVDSILSK